MKSLRIICGALGGIHYSSTPDLALDNCPVCGEACREIEVEVEVKKTLLDLLHEADSISLDDTFVRYFHLEIEECEEPDDIALDVSFDEYDYLFTKEEIENAVYTEASNSWEVADGPRRSVTIVCYKVNEIKP